MFLQIIIVSSILVLWVAPNETRQYNACPSLSLYPEYKNSTLCYFNPNVGAFLPDIVRRNGYDIETHTVTTKGGYLVTLHRIPPKTPTGQPVFIHHGINRGPIGWVDKKNNSLGYALHDAGYDVWIASARGTTYSKGHVTLKPNQPEFWNFCISDIADEDIPSLMEYIADETGQKGRILWIGHSMGTLLSFMYAASNPEHANSHLKGVVCLAPVAYFHHPRLVKSISGYWQTLRLLSIRLNYRALFADEVLTRTSMVLLVRESPFIGTIIISVIMGPPSGQFPPEDLLLYYSNFPISCSVDQWIQLLQIAHEEKFQRFDYGSEENMRRYGSDKPPVYNLGDVKLPFHLFYGLNDELSKLEDVERTFKELGSPYKKMTHIAVDKSVLFNHINFEYAKDAHELFFPHVLKALEDINQL